MSMQGSTIAAAAEGFHWKEHLQEGNLQFLEHDMETEYLQFQAISSRARLIWSFHMMSSFWSFWVLLSILDIVFLYPEHRMPKWGLFTLGFGVLAIVSFAGSVVLKKYPDWCSERNNSEKLSTAVLGFQCSFFCFLSANTYDSPFDQCLKDTQIEFEVCDAEIVLARWVMFAFTLACVPLLGLLIVNWMQVIRQKMFQLLLASMFLSHALRSLILTPLPPSSMYLWCFCFYVVFPVVFIVLFRNNEIHERRLYMLQREQLMARAHLEDKLDKVEQALEFEAPTAAETTAVERMIAVAGTLLQQLEIPFSELRLEQRIGSGAFGEVIKAEFRGVQVAVKRMLRSRINETSLKMLLAEVQLLSSIVHPNIVEFVGVSLDNVANICLVMELMDRGSLQDALKDPSLRMTWTDPLLKMLVDVVYGISYLHERQSPVIHRDLKPDNVLVTNTFGCKLTDFGASREAASDTTMTQIGTESYMAPEIIKGMRYDEKVDIYAVGILMIAMHNRGKTYDKERDDTKDNRRALFASILGGGRPPIPPSFPEALSEIAQACWQESPDKRPSASKLSRMLNKLKAEGSHGDEENNVRRGPRVSMIFAAGPGGGELPVTPPQDDWMDVPDQLFRRNESGMKLRSCSVQVAHSVIKSESDTSRSLSYASIPSSTGRNGTGGPGLMPTLDEKEHFQMKEGGDVGSGEVKRGGVGQVDETGGGSGNVPASFSAPREVPNQAVPGLEEMSTIMGATTIFGKKEKGGGGLEQADKSKQTEDTAGSEKKVDAAE